MGNVQHAGSPACGTGKTYTALGYTSDRMIEKIKKGKKLPTIIIASKSIALSKDAEKGIQKRAEKAEVEIPTLYIDKNEAAAQGISVSRMLSMSLMDMEGGEDKFCGVILCTHAALGLIDHVHLKGVEVFVDEVPDSSLAGIIRVKIVDVCGSTNNFIDLIHPEPLKSNPKKFTATLKPEMRGVAVMKLESARTGKDTSMSTNMVRILTYLLEKPDVEVLYHRKELETVSQLGVEEGSGDIEINKAHTHHFECIDTSRLKSLVTRAKKVTFLAASFESSLVHYVLTEVLNIDVRVNQKLFGGLPKKHTNPLTLYPVVLGVNWTKTLRKDLAHKRVIGGEGIDQTLTVQEYVAQIIEGSFVDNFLLFANNTDDDTKPEHRNGGDNRWYPFADYKTKNIKSLTTQVHGMNDLTAFTKAAFIASLNMSDNERFIYKEYSKVYEKTESELADIVKAERSYEACYQCVLRMMLRSNKIINQMCHAFVPDAAHAEYIMNKFEKGSMTIDGKYSLSIKKAAEVLESIEAKKQQKHDLRLGAAIEYHEAVRDKPKGVLVRDIQAQFEINKKTAQRWKKEFYIELKSLGLVK